jgi:chromosome segregation ATPase
MMDLGAKMSANLKGTISKIKEAETGIGTYRMIPVSQIQYNPKNRRKYLDEEVSVLAESIKELGLQQNIVLLQLAENAYKLIAGEKRTRAHKLLIAEGETGFDNIYSKVYKNLDEVQEELIMLQTNQLATVDNSEERALVAQRINELIDTLIEQGQKFGSRRDMMGELSGKSGKQVERDLKLNKIIPELLTLAQEKNLAQSGIIECANMPRDEQLRVYNMLKSMTENGNKPNRSEIIEVTKQHKEELKKLQDENEKMRQENQSLLKDKQSLEGKMKAMQGEIDSLSMEKGRMKKELMEKDGDIEGIRQTLEAEQKRNNPDRGEIERLQAQLQNAQDERQDINNMLQGKNDELRAKEKELHEISERANNVDNPLPRVQYNVELGFMLASLETTFNEVLKRYTMMNGDESIGVSQLNEERLMKLVEKIINTVQK